jgi:hypothetical protein
MHTQHAYHQPRTPRSGLESLQAQNQRFHGTTGVSAENRTLGFRPAFMNTRTGEVYLSRFGDGRLAPMHLLDGLPASVVLKRTDSGCVAAVHGWITGGFVRDNRFFTREQAVAATAHQN